MFLVFRSCKSAKDSQLEDKSRTSRLGNTILLRYSIDDLVMLVLESSSYRRFSESIFDRIYTPSSPIKLLHKFNPANFFQLFAVFTSLVKKLAIP